MSADENSHESERDSGGGGVNALAIGIALGLPLGSAIGMLVFDNIALGGGIGLLAGIVLGAAVDANRRHQTDDDATSD
ncbi:hypothetical protein [Microbacterium imperiale]|uniref:Glycine zipper family protein n=1 Tax=Microbacterium imperiale TaxID=33884 RepID=A0A9W6M3B9_9MICO|nr:hypothetical protein [Microbacterium imperiale]MBP2422011.1 ABC-type nitrate/sulfonate/bicarbonate transport system permease component [Microbacterium imperiale]MDS0200169.1 hypothetical protein [Microbacterium imperiale]BFE39318.1 hypothetical protein GCM10017544_02740 [Microbacterium imperiale]GLJ79816.1 hypothetical protein GCM10017586_14980 [Microbacterium imperiale]